MCIIIRRLCEDRWRIRGERGERRLAAETPLAELAASVVRRYQGTPLFSASSKIMAAPGGGGEVTAHLVGIPNLCGLCVITGGKCTCVYLVSVDACGAASVVLTLSASRGSSHLGSHSGPTESPLVAHANLCLRLQMGGFVGTARCLDCGSGTAWPCLCRPPPVGN
jgi:hypothetical protein